MKRRLPLLVLGMMTFASHVNAQQLKAKVFRDAFYYEPLLAEPRPARTMLLIPAWSKEFPHSRSPATGSPGRYHWAKSCRS